MSRCERTSRICVAISDVKSTSERDGLLGMQWHCPALHLWHNVQGGEGLMFGFVQSMINATGRTKERAPPHFRPNKTHLWAFDNPWGIFVSTAVKARELYIRCPARLTLTPSVCQYDTRSASSAGQMASGSSRLEAIHVDFLLPT